MKTKVQNQNSRLPNRPEQSGTASRRGRRNFNDPNQAELVGLIWQPFEYSFRLHAGDVIRLADNKICRVLHVNECAAVVIMNRPVRDFKTRFDRPVRFTPPPASFRISPQSECEILNRKPAPPRLTRANGTTRSRGH